MLFFHEKKAGQRLINQDKNIINPTKAELAVMESWFKQKSVIWEKHKIMPSMTDL